MTLEETKTGSDSDLTPQLECNEEKVCNEQKVKNCTLIFEDLKTFFDQISISKYEEEENNPEVDNGESEEEESDDDTANFSSSIEKGHVSSDKADLNDDVCVKLPAEVEEEANVHPHVHDAHIHNVHPHVHDSEDSDSDNEKYIDSCSQESLPIKLSQLTLEPTDEDEEEDEKINYLTRGPLIDHKNYGQNRYAPFTYHNSSSGASHCYETFNSPTHEEGYSESSALSSNYETQLYQTSPEGVSSPGFVGNDVYSNYGLLSPESIHSTDASPFCTPNYSSNFNYQSPSSSNSEFPFLDDTKTNASSQFYIDSFDFEPKSLESYQPISPPRSNSPPPPPQEEIDNIGSYGLLYENEDLKESEDLINIINAVSKTDQRDLPETEISKLRNLFEENENSLRDEMAIYLKDSDYLQQHSSSPLAVSLPSEDSNDRFTTTYDGPLTPPQSVSPFEEPKYLEGIHDIKPDELNIYLNEETSNSDPSKARKIIQDLCKPNNLDYALRNLSPLSPTYLCKKDKDGDTCLMIVYSQPENSPDFLENIFSLQEKLKLIRLCCESPLGKAKRCKLCGNTDPSKFYTPLSLKNSMGDSALSCAMKTDHSPLIINYLLDGILQCEEDFRRVFDEKGKAMLSDIAANYPSLKQYLY